jgi:mono/diheme cytochrome c family protein
MRRITTVLAMALLFVACTETEVAEEAQAGPDSTALAREAFDPTMFDTVAWESQDKALERGQVVYRFSCLKCHGDRGLGDAGFVRGGDTLRPPSFREPTWQYAGDKEGIREQVFVGTAETMPHWGLVGLGPRDVDAVAIYIMEGFRN